MTTGQIDLEREYHKAWNRCRFSLWQKNKGIITYEQLISVSDETDIWYTAITHAKAMEDSQ